MASVTPGDSREHFLQRLLSSVGVALFIGILVAEFFAPADLNLPICFGLSIALIAWSRNVALVWTIAILAVVAALLFAVFGPPAVNPQRWPAVLINRGLACFVTLAMAGVVHMRLAAERALRAQRGLLETQNAELEVVNAELSQREEEIVRQNEELQSQTEELERQSEELRVANEELAHWEKTLEQLLELSRALSADLDRGQVMDKICETLVLLSHGSPAAILERHDDELRIACHHGFGSGGPAAETIPLKSSFSALVMSVGQTAFLEDVQLRPELRLVQARDGESFRSVLSAPLRIHGRCVGTVELYSTHPRSWDETEISMVESIAAQASTSLQSCEQVAVVQAERRRFAAAFRTVPFGMLVADDPDAKEVRLNPAAATMFNVSIDDNLSPQSPIGGRIARCLRRGGHALGVAAHPLTRACAGEEILGEELELVFPQGRRLSLLACAAPIYDSAGRLAGGVCAFADVTAHKELQRELDLRRREAEEASVRKTRFLAAVSHDIRTPANAISLMAELIRRYAADPAMTAQIADCAEDLQRNTLSLIELVGDVLDLARFDSGKSDLVESDFSLADLVDQEVRQCLPIAQDKRVELAVEPISRTLWLRTDRVKLARVVGNLLGNAIKFTDQGRVTAGARVADDGSQRVLISISDTGMGIAQENLQNIFDEFRQLHNPARDRMKGSGLGLSIVKRLVDVMGGQIEVASRVGLGSTFTVALPASTVALRLEPALRTADVDNHAIAGAADQRLKGLRVLLVEDHRSTREGTARILQSEGATVDEAASGATALEKIYDLASDVILLDMMLPDLDGREVLRQLRLRTPAGLKAVFVLTGDLTEERLDEVRLLGADGLIEKPVDVKKLIDKLRALDGQLR